MSFHISGSGPIQMTREKEDRCRDYERQNQKQPSIQLPYSFHREGDIAGVASVLE